LVATTTDRTGTLLPELEFRATRTNAAITTRASTTPRSVNGRLEVRLLKVLKADQS